MYIRLFFLILLIPAGHSVFSQDIPGCTDPQANNYNPEANYNDGSCTYNPTIFNPSFQYLLPDDVVETSGLIFWNNALWTINDSGNDPVLFKLDTANGQILQEITISNASNIDWEAMAQDEDYIYIGDFGNNSGNRDDLGIYIIPKESIPASGNGTTTSSHLHFTYEDYQEKGFPRVSNNFDCEALIAIDDSLYLFTKNWGDEQTKLYRLPKTSGDFIAELIGEFNTAGLVTGADYNSESKEITLIGYTNNTFLPFLWLLFDYHDNRLFSGNKRRIDMLSIPGTQTEAISYVGGKEGSFSSEGNVLFTQSAYGFGTSQWTDTLATAIQPREAAKYDFILSPNPASGDQVRLTIKLLPPGDYNVELFDSSGRLMQIKEYSIQPDNETVQISLQVDHLQNGLYLVRMRSGSIVVEKKFIRQ
jgi:hypothetical protein